MKAHSLLSIPMIAIFVPTLFSHWTGHAETQEPAPIVLDARVPFYPHEAVSMGIEGLVHVKATTDGHHVISAHAQEDLKLLSIAAEENAKTWHFGAHTPLTFTIRYRYRLSDECGHDNPKVTMRFPTEVEVCQSPFHEY